MQQGKVFKAPCQWVSPLSDWAFDVSIVNESPSWLWNAKSTQAGCCSYPVNIPVLMSPCIWSFPARSGCYSMLAEGAVTFLILQFFWEQHRRWALSFYSLAPTKESWLLVLFWDKRRGCCLLPQNSYLFKSRKNLLQYLWLSVTKKLSVVCVSLYHGY